MDLDLLRPKRKDLVFDLVEEAGFDTADWIASSSQPHAYKANPKYCYEWSFVEPGKVAILNLWFASMQIENGQIVRHNNFRQDARGNAGNSVWVRRATKLDRALQAAVRENLVLRVIVNDGRMRERGNPQAQPSQVLARQLDPEFWTITYYDWDTGENTDRSRPTPRKVVSTSLTLMTSEQTSRRDSTSSAKASNATAKLDARCSLVLQVFANGAEKTAS